MPASLRRPGVPPLLRDLDEAACRHLPPALRRALIEEVVGRLRSAARLVLDRRLPALGDGLAPEQLDLSVRARHAIASGGGLSRLATFGDLLRVPNCHWRTVHEIACVLGSAPDRAQEASSLLGAADLEEEMAGLLDRESKRSRSIVLRRLGWNGRPPETLAAIGKSEGITRERVRQLVVQAVGRLRPRARMTPRIDRALEIAVRTAPAPTGAVARALARARVARRPFDPRGLLTAAEALGKDASLAVVQLTTGPALIPRRLGRFAARVDRAARLLVAQAGTGRIDTLVALTGAPGPNAVRSVLAGRGDVRWLDSGRRRFLLGKPEGNPIVQYATKALAGCDAVSGKVLCDILRAARQRAFASLPALPPEVLLDLFRSLDGFVVRGGLVRATGDRAERGLTPMEICFLRALRTHGPVLAHLDLERFVRREGFHWRHVASSIARVPLLVRYDHGIYGPADARTARLYRRATREGHGIRARRATPDGAVHVVYRLGTATAATGALRLPADLRPSPRFPPVLDESGDTVGRVIAGHRIVVGLRPWLARRRIRPGALLTLWWTGASPVRIAPRGAAGR